MVERVVISSQDPVMPPGEQSSTQEQFTSGERPEWLPEKFKSPEDLSKAYSELEKKLGASKSNEDNEAPAEAPDGQSESSEEVADELSKAVGFDLTDYYKEFENSGTLSEESLIALEAKGIPKDVVQRYMDGSNALSQQSTQDILNAIGGEATFNQMVLWAQNNLTPAELAAYNAAVDSGDINQAKLAVLGVHNKYSESVGKEPASSLEGYSSGPAAGAPFRSRGEALAAMSDPRYTTDSAYRQDVERKLINSNVFN